jgi:tetratricopeptide (TPR) repeat protein
MQQTIRLCCLAAAAALLLLASARADTMTVPVPGDTTSAPDASAQQLEDAKRYSDCMALARSTPEKALKAAQDWADKGGGIPAGHCNAVALVGLRRYADAATLMEKLALQEGAAGKDLAAGLYGQAGQARMMAGDYAHAVTDQTAALAMTPNDVELLTDRAVAEISMAKYWEAIDDLNKAHDLAANRVDVLIFRASAYRFLQSYDLARDDIDRAIALAPDDPEAYLERGVLRSLTKDPDGARADWQKTISLAPDTPISNQAKGNLYQLDQATKAQAPAATQAPAAQPVQPSLPLNTSP